jgi:antagonist of KipI
MSLCIVKPGVFDTVQDNGRYGYSKWGINPGGTMDRYAAQLANALVGNELTAAIIEIHFPAAEIQFQETSLISVTGADFTPFVNDTPVPLWKPLAIKSGGVLSFRGKRQGARCYLAVHAGLSIQPWLESFSTHTKVSAGGWMGRSLKKNDTLPFFLGRYSIDPLSTDVEVLPWSVNVQSVYTPPALISFVVGNEWSWLTSAAQQQLLDQAFHIDSSSDRMGYYLQEKPIAFQYREELLSSAVSMGTIQALPDGGLIVLMADHQTTGGYPRIGHVITAHLPRLAQRNGNETIRLNKISLADAEKIVFSLHQEVRNLQRSCREKLDQYYGKH